MSGHKTKYVNNNVQYEWSTTPIYRQIRRCVCVCVSHFCNWSRGEFEEGGSWVWGHLGVQRKPLTQKMSELITKEDSTMFCLYESPVDANLILQVKDDRSYSTVTLEKRENCSSYVSFICWLKNMGHLLEQNRSGNL